MIHDLEGRRGAEASAELEGLRVEAKTLMNKLWSETGEWRLRVGERVGLRCLRVGQGCHAMQ